MSRIYIGSGGLALFIGAVIGLHVGKGSWLLAFVGLISFLWGITAFWTRYSAARNALLAKFTFGKLDERSAREAVTTRVHEISGVSTLEMMATFTPAQIYGFYALAMASLGIPPAIPGEKWFLVRNPFTAVRNAEPEIASARHYFEKKYRIEIDLDTFR
jgi:hypothetical protein